MILHGTIQQIPAPGSRDDSDCPVDDVQVEAEDYDTAYARLTSQVPDGWRLILVRTA